MVGLRTLDGHCRGAKTHTATFHHKKLEQAEQMEGTKTVKLTPTTYKVGTQDWQTTVPRHAVLK